MYDGVNKLLLGNDWFIENFFQLIFEPDIIAELNIDKMSQYPTESIGEQNQQRLNDVMWKIHFNDGDELYVLLMIETQSNVDRMMALRIARYVINWYTYLEAKGDTKKGLPPIVPVVFYNGTKPWKAATKLRELIALPEESRIGSVLMDAQFILVDGQHEVRTGKLPSDNVVTTLLRAVHSKDTKEFMENFDETTRFVIEAGQSEEFLDTIINFIRAHKRFDKSEWFKSVSNQELADMASIGIPEWEQEFIQKGIEQGIERGIEQGIDRGAESKSRDILRSLLAQRFGDLDTAVETKVERASGQQLDRWLDRVIIAPTLSEIFK